MPRIRTLKPQFWDSPSTAKADLAPRLLYMALWNWADDAGRGTANLKELEAFAFPNDDIPLLPRRTCGNSAPSWRNFAELFWETVQAFDVTLYEVGKRRFYEISSFRVHQSKNFRPDSQLPSPADGRTWDLASEYGFNNPTPTPPGAEIPPDSSGNSAISCRTSPLDRDRERDWDRDGDNNPPTPHDDEPDDQTPLADRLLEPLPTEHPPGRNNGAALARRRFTAIPSEPSQLARQLARAYSDSLDTPIEAGTLREISDELDACIQAGQTPPAITAGIALWADSDSFSPKQIPKYITKAAQQRNKPTHGKPTAKALAHGDAAEQLIAEMENQA